MPHQRKLIRDAVVAQLRGKTHAGQRVFPTRILPLRNLELPAISVYTLEESVSDVSKQSSPRELTRELPMHIEAWVRANDNVDDAMDEISEQIEAAMHADPFFGGVLADSVLDDTALEVAEEGGRPLGIVTLTYAVTYRTLAPEPPKEPDLFITAEVTHQKLGVEAAAAAHDEFVVQEVS